MKALSQALLCGAGVVLYGGTGLASTAFASATSSTASASGEDGFECSIDIKLYDLVQLESVYFGLEARYECTSPIPDVSLTEGNLPDDGWQAENFPDGFEGPAIIARCVADFDHFECPPLLEELPTTTYEAEGPGGPLLELPHICVASVECSDWPCIQTGPFVADVCGDPDRSGTIQTTDALITLRAAVSLTTCASAQCDADRNGVFSTADALRVLRTAVGEQGELNCPAPCEGS
jgi:hypothetical protein